MMMHYVSKVCLVWHDKLLQYVCPRLLLYCGGKLSFLTSGADLMIGRVKTAKVILVIYSTEY